MKKSIVLFSLLIFRAGTIVRTEASYRRPYIQETRGIFFTIDSSGNILISPDTVN